MTPADWDTLTRWYKDNDAVLETTIARKDLLFFVRHCDPIFVVETDDSDLLAGFRDFVTGVIARLTQFEEFSVGPDLQQMLDQSVYSPHITRLFEAFWTARFEKEEGKNIDARIATLATDTFDAPSYVERCDGLLFWLTLLAQNYGTGPIVFLLHTPPSPEREQFLRIVKHWAGFESPLKVAVTRA